MAAITKTQTINLLPITNHHHHHHNNNNNIHNHRRIDSLQPPSSHRSHDIETPATATILIGPQKTRFVVDKQTLCTTSPFFHNQLHQPQPQPQRPSHAAGNPKRHRQKPVSLWLPGESASMFALFTEYLGSKAGFRWFLAGAVATALETSQQAVQDLHWAVVRLHLFASRLGLHQLQDTAMDAVQDLYLRCRWDVYPALIAFLYTKCDAIPAVRLRRWAVAMVAYHLSASRFPPFAQPSGTTTNTTTTADADASSISSPSSPRTDPWPSTDFDDLFDTLPEFAEDYEVHDRKMRVSGLDPRFKNPQRRLPANKLRNDERAFGFRECSFHSHRATIGERRCPYYAGTRVGSCDGSSSGGGKRMQLMTVKMDFGPEEKGMLGSAAYDQEQSSRTGDGWRPEMQRNPSKVAAETEVKEITHEVDKALKHIRSISSTRK